MSELSGNVWYLLQSYTGRGDAGAGGSTGSCNILEGMLIDYDLVQYLKLSAQTMRSWVSDADLSIVCACLDQKAQGECQLPTHSEFGHRQLSSPAMHASLIRRQLGGLVPPKIATPKLVVRPRRRPTLHAVY